MQSVQWKRRPSNKLPEPAAFRLSRHVDWRENGTAIALHAEELSHRIVLKADVVEELLIDQNLELRRRNDVKHSLDLVRVPANVGILEMRLLGAIKGQALAQSSIILGPPC